MHYNKSNENKNSIGNAKEQKGIKNKGDRSKKAYFYHHFQFVAAK